MIRVSLISFLVLSSCTYGDFCDVSEPIQTDDRTLAATMVQLDRPFSERIAEHNLLGQNLCGWSLN